jgi:hypothetical protein
MEPLASVCFDDRAGQTFAPLLLPFHDRKLHIVNPEKKVFTNEKKRIILTSLNMFNLHSSN